MHGEFSGHLLYPCTFPSYNNLSGPEDRWSFGFQNFIHITPKTRFLAQLATHDDGKKRAKFDWHFSLRQDFINHLVFIFGHDSNHDPDFQSQLDGRSCYLNRNYLEFSQTFIADMSSASNS